MGSCVHSMLCVHGFLCALQGRLLLLTLIPTELTPISDSILTGERGLKVLKAGGVPAMFYLAPLVVSLSYSRRWQQ